MSNPEDKIGKSNGLTGDPMQRLASFKPPRDLSLGGVKPNKKIFTPNLNVARNKNKGLSMTNVEHKKDHKNRKDDKNFKNKKMRNGPNLIKSGGVFSEGLGGGIERHSTRIFHGRDSNSQSTARSIEKPTLRVKDMVKIDKELEEQKIKLAVGGSMPNDDDICEDFKKALEIDAPVKLPMDNGGWLFGQTKPPVKVKEEVVVKTEPDDNECMLLDRKPMPEVKRETFEDNDAFNLLKMDQPTLILLQLPDTLPGRGGSVQDDSNRRSKSSDAATSSRVTSDEKQVEDRCYLSDLEEGRIGKLRLHRSGRVMLALGDTVLEVCAGTKSAFHQEVVSVGVDEDSRSANLISLGPLLHKLFVVPDWETMFIDSV